MLAVITGATQGIGRALVDRFAAEGFDLVFCARTAANVETLVQDLRKAYPLQQFWGLALDMSKNEGIETFAEAVLATGQSPEVLINNAGVFLPCSLSEAKDRPAFELMMQTNLQSAYILTQCVLPSMIAAARGYIFNMCSIASFMPYSGYSVSKFALLGYSKVLREELKTKGIRVSAVMPGATLTNSWAGVDLPEARFMKASDIAQAIWACYGLSPQTVVEELVLRPQLGDI